MVNYTPAAFVSSKKFFSSTQFRLGLLVAILFSHQLQCKISSWPLGRQAGVLVITLGRGFLRGARGRHGASLVFSWHQRRISGTFQPNACVCQPAERQVATEKKERRKNVQVNHLDKKRLYSRQQIPK